MIYLQKHDFIHSANWRAVNDVSEHFKKTLFST